MEIRVTKLSEFVKLLQKNDLVSIKSYKKKDGSSRDVNCTLNFEVIPKEKHPDDSTKTKMKNLSKKGLVTVFDIDKNDWRSLVIKKITWCNIGKDLYDISINTIY